jgi:hypothetical protein
MQVAAYCTLPLYSALCYWHTHRQKGSAPMTDHAAEDQEDQRSTDYLPVTYPTASRPMESTRIVRSDASALADLQSHWGSVYEIGLDGDIWSATFLGTADQLRAHTCLELRVLIRADYAYRQQAGPARRAAAEPAGRDPRSADDNRRLRPVADGGDEVIRGERMSL